MRVICRQGFPDRTFKTKQSYYCNHLGLHRCVIKPGLCCKCNLYNYGEDKRFFLFADWMHVRLQIIDKAKMAGSDEDALALTGTVTTRLRHPCIVRVFAHCVTDGLTGTKPWDSALSQQGARYDNACWMLLEYCDKGTLLVRPTPQSP